MKIKKSIICLLKILAFFTCFGFNACTQKYTYESLDSFFQTKMANQHIPGLSACIVKNDQVTWIKAYGFADIEHDLKMHDNTILNIASISKTFTATAIMQLWEKNMLVLESNVNKYLPFDITNPYHPETAITIHQLFTHTSSIRDGSAYGQSYTCGDPKINLKEWIEQYLLPNGRFFNQEENFIPEAPGTTQSYSNVGYGLLGLIVEEITKQPFQVYCRENIFQPLQMNDTGWFIHEIDQGNHAKPTFYLTENNINTIKEQIGALIPDTSNLKPGRHVATCLYSFPNFPDGLVRTSVSDLSHFLIAMLNGGNYMGNEILRASTTEKMLSPQLKEDAHQGLCWSHSGFESFWGHGGDDPGVQTGLFFSQKLDIGMIMLQNSNEGSRTNTLKRLYETAKYSD
jgi:CubicO group peptidase (beta-lactamase class C family)